MKIILRNSIKSRGCRGAVSQKLYFCLLVLLRLCEALPFPRQRLLCGKFMQNENTKTTKNYRHRCAISHIFQIMHISHINWECFWNYSLERGSKNSCRHSFSEWLKRENLPDFFKFISSAYKWKLKLSWCFRKELKLINPLWQPLYK